MEFNAVLRTLGLPLTTSELQSIEESFTNNDTRVKYKSFLKYVNVSQKDRTKYDNDSSLYRNSTPSTSGFIRSPTVDAPSDVFRTPRSNSSVNFPHNNNVSWQCKVCFHMQDHGNVMECEMCKSKNPKKLANHSKVVLQCCICAHQNTESATSCTLCGIELQHMSSYPLSPSPRRFRDIDTRWIA